MAFKRPDPDCCTLLLVRHAHTDAVGRVLTGRLPHVPLSARGRAEAERLASMFCDHAMAAIYTSPLERALDTAQALAVRCRAPVRVREDLIEIDFGEWTGKTFEELATMPQWQRFNESRARAAVPGGEGAMDAQCRIVRALSEVAASHPGDQITVVTHADMIRYALLHYTRTSLDLVHQIEIDPASVTTVVLSASDAQVHRVNETAGAPPDEPGGSIPQSG